MKWDSFQSKWDSKRNNSKRRGVQSGDLKAERAHRANDRNANVVQHQRNTSSSSSFPAQKVSIAAARQSRLHNDYGTVAPIISIKTLASNENQRSSGWYELSSYAVKEKESSITSAVMSRLWMLIGFVGIEMRGRELRLHCNQVRQGEIKVMDVPCCKVAVWRGRGMISLSLSPIPSKTPWQQQHYIYVLCSCCSVSPGAQQLLPSFFN